MPDTPIPSPDRPDRRGLSVLEAARQLGTTPDSVRSRLRRRTLEGYRDNAGRWRVVLPDGTRDGPDRKPTERATPNDGAPTVAAVGDGRGELITELRARIEELQAALEVERERVDRLMEALAAGRPRRPWPGLKTWWRRVWEGEGSS